MYTFRVFLQLIPLKRKRVQHPFLLHNLVLYLTVTPFYITLINTKHNVMKDVHSILLLARKPQ